MTSYANALGSSPAGIAKKFAPKAVEPEPELMRRVTVRSHTKVIYLFPSAFFALLAAWRSPVEGSEAWGNPFMALFLANLLIVLFEFDSIRMLFLGLVGLVVGLAAWVFGLAPMFNEALGSIHVVLNAQALGFLGVFFLLLILGDMLWAHLNRWEFEANNIRHVQLFAGQTENFPGRSLRYQIATVDVLERLLLGSGTLLLSLGSKKVRLQNVPFIRRKVRDLEKFVRTAGVYNDTGDAFDQPDDFEDS